MKNYFPVSLVVIIGTLATGLASYGIARWQINQQKSLFKQQADLTVISLQRNFDRYTDVILSLNDYFSSSPEPIERSEFEDFTRRSIEQFQGIRALEWAPLVTDAQRAEFESRIRQEGFTDFEITEQLSDQIGPARERSQYFPVLYIVPFEPNAQALGFDLASDPIRDAALMKAATTGQLSVTSRIRLVQETDRQYGFLAFIPTHTPSADPSTDLSLNGMVIGVFRISDIAIEALRGFVIPQNVYFFDSAELNEQTFLGRYNTESKMVSSEFDLDLLAIAEQNRICQDLLLCTHTLTVGDRQWSVLTIPTSDYWRGADFRAYEVLAVGGLITLGASLYLTTLIRNAAELAGANREILRLNTELQDENTRMGTELDILKRMQRMILPKPQDLQIKGLDIAGYMEPALDVGGDYYDVICIEDIVTISMGDVTGHGLESGIIMLMAQTSVRTLRESGELDPIQFLSTLNRTLYNNIKRMDCEKNLSLIILNYRQGRLTLSGQHEEVILVRANGQIERIKTVDLGLPIGLDLDISDFIDHKIVEMAPGDGIVLYTDGITDAQNSALEFYGIERLEMSLLQNWQHPAEAILKAVIDHLHTFIGEYEVFDDISILILKRTEIPS